jgi:hypothetical protein
LTRSGVGGVGAIDHVVGGWARGTCDLVSGDWGGVVGWHANLESGGSGTLERWGWASGTCSEWSGEIESRHTGCSVGG